MTIASGQPILAADVTKAVNHAQASSATAQTAATAAYASAATADTHAVAALAVANTAAANAAAARAPVAGLQQQIDNSNAANNANVTSTTAQNAQLGALENRIAALEAGGGVVIPPPPPGQVPNSPTAPTSTAVTSASVSLSATAPASGGAADSYTIQRALAGTGTFTDAITVQAPTVTGTLPSLAASTSYDIGVVAKNATGPGPRSAIITRATIATAPPPSGAPARASAQGYNTQTFGPNLILSGAGQNWLPASESGGPGTFTNNTDGSVTLIPPSNASDGRQWQTAHCNIGSYMSFNGRGFGGGGYFVARMKWAAGAGISPAFWSNDIEGQTGFGVANSPVQWPGQGGDYNLWFEPDFMEAGGADFGSSMWQWYGTSGNPQGIQPLAARTSVSNTNIFHDYGFLWVPATSAHGGFAAFDVDGREYGRASWPFRANRNTLPGPPPTPGSDSGSNITVPTCSDMDWRHLFLMLGSDPGFPFTVASVSIWQTNGNANITA